MKHDGGILCGGADDVMREFVARRLDVGGYVGLLDQVGEGKIGDADFQRKFNGFCMIRRDKAWRKEFYGIFADLAKRRESVTLKNVLGRLDRRVEKIKGPRLEFSFATKMLAFLRPEDSPIWDRWIMENVFPHLGCDVKPLVHGSIRSREKAALEIYDKLRKWYADALKSDWAKDAIRGFDQYIPSRYRTKIPPIKKLDWLLWANQPPKNCHALDGCD